MRAKRRSRWRVAWAPSWSWSTRSSPNPTNQRVPALWEEGGRRLNQLANALRARGLAVEPLLVEGYAEDELAAAAQRLDASLVVIGTHGRPRPLRWLLGSVAERTLQSSAVPVLVVGEAAPALTEWADGARTLRVTIALESADPAAALVDVAIRLRDAGPCELTFVHVASRALLGGPLPLLIERAMRDRLANLRGAIRIFADAGSLPSSLAAFLKANPCDLVVVGIHARSGFDFPRTAEVARSLLHRRVWPILGVPLGARPAAVEGIPRFRNVLVATDLSDMGNRAVADAYALGGAGATVTLLYVHTTPTGAPVPLDPTERGNLRLRLVNLVPADADALRIVTNILIVEGDKPAEVIVDAASRLAADVICLGSRGRSALGRALLGSVAEEVVHRFPKAVLIVR